MTPSACSMRVGVERPFVQFPGTVTELDTGLADVEVADL